MNTQAANNKVWSKEINTNVMLYPNERVVAFLGRNYRPLENNHGKNALDVGFGSGRHVKLLMDYGFTTTGIDLSEDCRNVAEGLLGEHPLLEGLYTTPLEEFDEETHSFDVIVNFGVAFLQTYDGVIELLTKIHGLLEENGKVFMNFRTTDDFLYGKGEKVGEHSFVLDASAGSYEGLTYTFFTQEGVEEIMRKCGFSITSIERDEYYKNQLIERHTWWLITAEKA